MDNNPSERGRQQRTPSFILKDGESPKEAIERSYKSSTKLKESRSEHPETNTLRKLLISNPKGKHYSRLFDLAQRGRERGKLARLIACKRSVNRRSGTFIVSNQSGEVYKKASKCVSRKGSDTAQCTQQPSSSSCFNPRSRKGSDDGVCSAL